MKYIACDPGHTGGIVLFEDSNIINIWDMPTKKIKVGKNNRTTIDGKALNDIFKSIGSVDAAVIEAVTAFSGQGVTSTMNFGKAYGQVIQAAYTCTDNVIYVRPKVWQEPHSLPKDKKERKTELNNIAKKLYPNTPLVTPRGRLLDGRSDAILIGKWYIDTQGTT